MNGNQLLKNEGINQSPDYFLAILGSLLFNANDILFNFRLTNPEYEKTVKYRFSLPNFPFRKGIPVNMFNSESPENLNAIHHLFNNQNKG